MSVRVGPLQWLHWSDSRLDWSGKWGSNCYETKGKAEAAAVIAAAKSPKHLGHIKIVEREVPHYNYPFAVRRKKT